MQPSDIVDINRWLSGWEAAAAWYGRPSNDVAEWPIRGDSVAYLEGWDAGRDAAIRVWDID